MNENLVTYQTLESPQKTTGVIVGVSLLVLGLGAVVTYLVLKNREGDTPVKEEEKGSNVQSLLDKLGSYQIGNQPKPTQQKPSKTFGEAGPSAPQNVPEDVGCDTFLGIEYTTLKDIDESVASRDHINACGKGIYEFQMFLNEEGYLPFEKINGRYGTSTLQAHNRYLRASR